MTNDELKNERLIPLSELRDYKVAKDNPDVTGWRVVGADGEELGEVKDLIVDMNAMRVRYLSVVAERRFFDRENDTFLLLPIGAAALDRSGKNVFLSSLDATSIRNYPLYGGGPIPADYEYAVRDNFRRANRDSLPDNSDTYKSEFDQAVTGQSGTTRHISDDFYEDDSFNEDRFYTATPTMHTRDRDNVNRSDADYKDADQQRDYKPKSVEDSIMTIERLEDLRERGSITEEEFILLKKRALDS
jgi:photosynthetic reaction center H subunit